LPQYELRPFTDRYLQLGYAHTGLTIYDGDAGGVRNLPPTITNHIDRFVSKRPRETHAQADFEQLIETAVATRLESDVPLGCFLSGGVDSSLIAHFAKEHKNDLRTFTVRMPDERYDESAHAEEVAEHLGTDHVTIDLDLLADGQSAIGNRQSEDSPMRNPNAECRMPSAVPINPAQDLTHLITILGQPFGDSSILPTYWVSKAARQHVTVALSGDGGDELFMGYERYMAARHLNRHRRLLQWIPRRWLRGTHPKSRWHKLGRLGEMARDLRTLGIAAMESIFTQHQLYDLLGDRAREPVKQPAGRDPMQSLRQFDLTSYLPDDLLCKVDTASMAVALEVRCPFLDRDLVQAALAAPTWQLAPSGKRKGLLRDIARKYLPDSIVDRPKMGFAIPIGEWFRNDFGGMKSLLVDHLTGDASLDPLPLRREAVKRLVDEHLSEEYDHGQRLFALLTLAMWRDMTLRER
jgi:asparagine synthase (glutamine-hydrolysing)